MMINLPIAVGCHRHPSGAGEDYGGQDDSPGCSLVCINLHHLGGDVGTRRTLGR
jgi:hypothetical protein